jgi:hypothetical protein
MNKTKLDFDEVNIMQEYNTIEFAKETEDYVCGCSRDGNHQSLATGLLAPPLVLEYYSAPATN